MKAPGLGNGIEAFLIRFCAVFLQESWLRLDRCWRGTSATASVRRVAAAPAWRRADTRGAAWTRGAGASRVSTTPAIPESVGHFWALLPFPEHLSPGLKVHLTDSVSVYLLSRPSGDHVGGPPWWKPVPTGKEEQLSCWHVLLSGWIHRTG